MKEFKEDESLPLTIRKMKKLKNTNPNKKTYKTAFSVEEYKAKLVYVYECMKPISRQ